MLLALAATSGFSLTLEQADNKLVPTIIKIIVRILYSNLVLST